MTDRADWLTKEGIEFEADDSRQMICPRCGGGELHQRLITVYDREEDDELTTVTTVDEGVVSSQLQPSDDVANPSARRHGLTIHFECEMCTGELVLRIAQHKGATLIDWGFEPDQTEVPNPTADEIAEATAAMRDLFK